MSTHTATAEPSFANKALSSLRLLGPGIGCMLSGGGIIGLVANVFSGQPSVAKIAMAAGITLAGPLLAVAGDEAGLRAESHMETRHSATAHKPSLGPKNSLSPSFSFSRSDKTSAPATARVANTARSKHGLKQG
jgi:hypothetical protein